MKLPQIEDIHQAAERIRGEAVVTPLISNSVLDERVGARVLLKAECLQCTGSFKFRGAYNALKANRSGIGDGGVVACSSGNHAQGVAEAARLLGMKATIVMPSDAPDIKKMRTKRSGADIVEYDRANEDREAIAGALARETGAVFIHPYDNFHVIAGQGTCGLEAAQQCIERDIVPDRLLVCTGGGGLLAGMRLAVADAFPSVSVHTVEPEGYDDQARSHAIGQRVGDNAGGETVCDAIATPSPGELSFAMCNGRLAEGLVVSDEEALEAVAFAFNELKLVVEPGGAVTLAALLSGKLDVSGQTVVATLSGGNADPTIVARALKA
ncbi:MAG: threonine/serine dehydratase [Ahrensia sp.]|nr:threonine/serine dehydratase [Ahrensia sp.]